MSYLITTEGKYLGEKKDNQNEILVVFPTHSLSNKDKNDPISKEESTPLIEKSAKIPGYQKPISITEQTWESIIKAGGKRPNPVISNNSSTIVYIKPETKVLEGPGKILDHKTPIALLPHECIYGAIDGVNTQTNGVKVFKVVDGVKVVVLPNGEVKITAYRNWISRIGQWWQGGWKDQRERSSWIALSSVFEESSDNKKA